MSLFNTLAETDSSLAVEEMLFFCLGKILKRWSTGEQNGTAEAEKEKRIEGAKDYLRTYSDQEMNLDELAEVVGLSKYYFLRTFRKTTGITPHQFLIQLRVNQAKKLLLTDQSINQVAQEVGFCDQSHLNRHFKRYVQVTPGQYRKESLRSH
jgi:AraC-like DNA-binding protein